jgi:hypothetical protein
MVPRRFRLTRSNASVISMGRHAARGDADVCAYVDAAHSFMGFGDAALMRASW